MRTMASSASNISPGAAHISTISTISMISGATDDEVRVEDVKHYSSHHLYNIVVRRSTTLYCSKIMGEFNPPFTGSAGDQRTGRWVDATRRLAEHCLYISSQVSSSVEMVPLQWISLLHYTEFRRAMNASFLPFFVECPYFVD